MDTERQKELGYLLRETREKLGLTRDEIEGNIHIRVRYLEAMEDGAFDELPSPVQARGFLHNYTEYLGLDPDEVLLTYAESIQERSKARNLDQRTNAALRKSRRIPGTGKPGWLNGDLILSVFMAFVLVAAIAWGGMRMLDAAASESSTKLEASAGLAAEPEESPTQEPTAVPTQGSSLSMVLLTPSETPTLDLVLNTTSGVGVTVVIERSTWIRVVVDGEEQETGRFEPGVVLDYRGEETVEVAAGNAGGVRIFYRGDDLGLMGNLDQAMTRIWTLDGVITPTPVITETSTPTPTPTVTATPDLTITGSPEPGSPIR